MTLTKQKSKTRNLSRRVFTPAPLAACIATLLLSAVMPAAQAEPFKPEVFTVEKTIQPGPNVFMNEAAWGGASQIHVFAQDDLHYKGSMPAGITSQMKVSKDGKTVYVLSDFAKRITYGPVESVVQVYDVDTLSRKKEIIVPNKAVKAIGMTQLLELSADEKLLYVQNATPATSVSVIDIAAGEVITEVPTPGCYGVYPALKGSSFSTPCGTGQLKTFTLKGKEYSVEASGKLFDVDADPIYIHSERRKNGELILTTFGGALYLADDSGKTVKIKEKLQVNTGIEGDWAPGGYAITAYSSTLDMVFMLMHSGAYDGSHKNGSEEIWAYSLKKKKLISRSPAPHMVALSVTEGKTPVLFGSNEEDETIDKYVLSSDGDFMFEKAAADEKAGWTTSLAVSHD
ncbi:MAG: hypothetical protein CMI06_08460 [Oceanospirillaceae bacterium]|nr:hypothetical protein [Oceanospirillaceae bacterium]